LFLKYSKDLLIQYWCKITTRKADFTILCCCCCCYLLLLLLLVVAVVACCCCCCHCHFCLTYLTMLSEFCCRSSWLLHCSSLSCIFLYFMVFVFCQIWWFLIKYGWYMLEETANSSIRAGSPLPECCRCKICYPYDYHVSRFLSSTTWNSISSSSFIIIIIFSKLLIVKYPKYPYVHFNLIINPIPFSFWTIWSFNNSQHYFEKSVISR